MIKQKNWLNLLSEAGIENPSQELRYIKRYAIKDEDIDEIVSRRCKREPLAKIMGYKDFWKDSFITNKHTLDPRSDSEILIEACLELSIPNNILELGVGTGCLILSLLKEYPEAKGLGVDLSEEALKVALQNAQNLEVDFRIKFTQSNWFSNIAPQQFDLIISNPPYIAYDEVINEEAKYDPVLALYAQEKGFSAYKIILERAYQFLSNKGYLVFEIGPSWVYYKVENSRELTLIKTIKDLSKNDRVVIFQKN